MASGILNHDGDIIVSGQVRASRLSGPLVRSDLVADNLAVFDLPLPLFRVWDAMQTNLPSVGAADDLGLATGAFGTGLPFLKTIDLNALGAATEYARTTFTLPAEYVAGGPISVRLAALMLTSIASVSATVDVEAYASARTTLKTGSDLVTTSATSANLLTTTEAVFVLTPTNRLPGDVLDIRVAWIGNSATASSHFGAIAHAEVLLQIKG